MRNIVQIKNPKSGKYIKINRSKGKVIAHKLREGAYVGIEIIESKERQNVSNKKKNYDK